jgi:hypothetical protein
MSNERTVDGAVSWESIAQARMVNPQADLRAAIVPAVTVMAHDDLLSNIPKIIEAGYVFVRAQDRKIQGIVTTSDLSHQFAVQASPFLYLSEIERRLRVAIASVFTVEELRECVDEADGERKDSLGSVDDLSIGEYQRLLEKPDRWERMQWRMDRKVFIAKLDSVRSVRNEVMHFSPDPLDSAQIKMLINFLRWLRKLNVGG